MFAAHREAVVYGGAADFALDIEDTVDAPDGLERERRQLDRLLAALQRGGDVGEFEEVAPGVGPAQRPDQRRG